MHAEQDRAVEPDVAPDAALPDVDACGSEAHATVITVMIASDRLPLREEWRALLACAPGIEPVGAPPVDATTLADRVERALPAILLLDKALLDALDARSLRRLHALRPQVRVLLLWDELGPGLVADVWRHRFHGYLLIGASPHTCLKAIRAVCRGELWMSRPALAMAFADLLSPPDDIGASLDAPGIDATDVLTPRERQVVERLRRGCINKEIACELGIREDTVKKHLQNVFAKLGVHRRALVALRRLPAPDASAVTAHVRRLPVRSAIEAEVVPLARNRAPAFPTSALRPG